jgi:predicted acetyltransferase
VYARRVAIEIRTVSDDEVPAFRHCILTTFGEDLDADPEGDARMRALIPAAQRWGAFDGKTVVGTAGTYDHAIGVPGGGTIPMAGLTIVTVRPTHRRRGLLRALMQFHLEDARQRGFAIAGLWASEASIYGRFRYGIAAHSDVITIENAQTVVLREGVRADDAIDWLDDAAARDLLPAIYARATAERPGVLRRTEVWWRERRFIEAPLFRGGMSKRRHVIARRGGEPVGYLAYRQKGAFDVSGPNGKLDIVELVAIDSRAELSLWQFALRADLYPNVSYWNAPVDDALAWAVTDPRRIQRRRTDSLWLRIEDPAKALAARGYGADGTLRFASDGAAWELVVEAGHGRCSPTTRAAELVLAPTALGSLYLGGVSATQLARASLVRGDVTALALADRMFASSIAPWCPEVF